MTSWGCCVLVNERSGELMVHANELGLSRTDVSGSEFEVGAPTSEKKAERKKSVTKRATKNPLTAVLESWLLSILKCRFSFISVAHFLSVSRWRRNNSTSFRKRRCVDWRGDWWAVEAASHRRSPALRIMRSSFALWCLNRLSVVNSTSSCGWPSILSFRFFSTRSTSCFSRIRAFALIPWMEYDVVFPSIFVNFFIPGFVEDCSWFTTHSAAFLWDCSFRCRICSSVSSGPSACVKKICSSSATSEEDVDTFMGVGCTSSRTLRWIFSVAFSSSLEKKSAAVLTETMKCAILKFNCST